MTLPSLARCSSLLLVALVPLGSAVAQPDSTRQDITAVRAHWESWEIAADSGSTHANVESLTRSEQPDGCWADIDYADQHVSVWGAGKHLEHLNQLATVAYTARHNGQPDTALEKAAVLALHCWLQKDLHNPNWWWNEIGAPKSLGRAALLLQPLLSASDIADVTNVLLRSKWTRWTGQNLVWGVDVQLMRGLLHNDDGLVREAFQRMYQEIRIAPLWLPNGKPGEGIEADGSFHQHGAQLYSGGYGLSFAHDVAREIVLAWGTSFQAPPEVIAIYSHFLLDGEQWMMRGGVFDYVARGREITRNEQKGRTNFLRTAQALAALPLPRQAEYKRFAASLALPPQAAEVSGNRAFWNSDFMEHKRAGYATSVRMLSTRSKNEETLNGEGMRSVHLADGANLLYKTGQEYDGIFPVWDWNLIPGTTALQAANDNGVPLTGELQSIGQMGRSGFAGEVSDDTYGAAAMVLERGPLTAKKAWFFFDNLYVALGAGIHMAQTSGIPNARVVTTVEQSRLQGEVSQKQLPDGRTLVGHHGVGYILSPGAKPSVRSAPQTGSWSLIGTGPATPITMPVFRLTLDHGPQPADGSYQYIVLPEGGMSSALAEVAAPTMQVLANTSLVQAVMQTDRRMLMAVFYAPGSLTTPMGELQVDAPAILLLRREGRSVSIAVSNPLASALTLHVSLGDRTSTIDLPGGNDAGRSVKATLQP